MRNSILKQLNRLFVWFCMSQSFEIFELEPHQDCSYDHIVLYDGDSTDSYMMGRYCGSKPPYPIISNANQLYMVFKSDSSVQRKGFLAHHATGKLLCLWLISVGGIAK